MEKVEGIGGLFFRANDPEALSAWYEKNLGVAPPVTGPDGVPWRQAAGVTVFSPFPQDSEYFGDRAKHWMLNFRVRDLDAMVAQLRAGGVEVVPDPEPYPYGRFARLHDPEGNPIELWQPSE